MYIPGKFASSKVRHGFGTSCPCTVMAFSLLKFSTSCCKTFRIIKTTDLQILCGFQKQFNCTELVNWSSNTYHASRRYRRQFTIEVLLELGQATKVPIRLSQSGSRLLTLHTASSPGTAVATSHSASKSTSAVSPKSTTTTAVSFVSKINKCAYFTVFFFS